MPLFTKNYSKPGSPPGEALLQESGGGEASVLTLMDFSEQRLAEKIESIENKIFESPEPASLDAIHSIRHRLIFLRDC